MERVKILIIPDISAKESDGYVTIEVEKYLQRALSNPGWTDIFTKCKDNLSIMDDKKSLPKQFPNSGKYHIL